MNELQKLFDEGILGYYVNNTEIIAIQDIIPNNDNNTYQNEIMEQLVGDYIFEDIIYIIEEEK